MKTWLTSTRPRISAIAEPVAAPELEALEDAITIAGVKTQRQDMKGQHMHRPDPEGERQQGQCRSGESSRNDPRAAPSGAVPKT